MSGIEVKVFSRSTAAIFSLFCDLETQKTQPSIHKWTQLQVFDCFNNSHKLDHLVARSTATAPPRDLPNMIILEEII